MSVSASVPATVHIRRSRLVGLLAGVAAVAAAVTWLVLVLAFDEGSTTASLPRASQITVSSAAQDARRIPSIMALTPARLAGGALGTGYALPAVQSGPTTASVLASMSPETRRYTKAVMALTFAQLAAGGAGHP